MTCLLSLKQTFLFELPVIPVAASLPSRGIQLSPSGPCDEKEREGERDHGRRVSTRVCVPSTFRKMCWPRGSDHLLRALPRVAFLCLAARMMMRRLIGNSITELPRGETTMTTLREEVGEGKKRRRARFRNCISFRARKGEEPARPV